MSEKRTGLRFGRLGHKECLQHVELERILVKAKDGRLPDQLLRVLD